MSVTLSQTTPKARKRYVCEWCGEFIHKGEQHQKWCGVYYGELHSSRMHDECHNACLKDMSEDPYEYEFNPYEHQRGSTHDKGCSCGHCQD